MCDLNTGGPPKISPPMVFTEPELLASGKDSVVKCLDHHQQAMQALSRQYTLDEFSIENLIASLDIFHLTYVNGGKIILCGIGKLFKIANKLVATLNSLLIPSQPLHPSEALHGDLGLINEETDCLVLVTASGNTPELLQLLPHLLPELPMVLLTCSKNSKLSNHPMVNSLMYVELPPHLNEDLIHGLPAPTVLTSLSLILADATVLALSEMIEDDLLKRKTQFSKKHPGGSIGLNLSHLNDNHMKISSQTLTALLVSLSQLASKDYGSLVSSDYESGPEDKGVPSLGTPTISTTELISRETLVNAQLLSLVGSLAHVLLVPRREVMALLYGECSKFVEWVAMYDYLVVTTDNVVANDKHAVAMEHVRMLYRNHFTGKNDEDAWNQFKMELMLAFVPVSF